MENISSEHESQKLYLDDQSLGYLHEVGRWAFFLSIVGFVGCGILVLVGLFLGSMGNTVDSPTLSMLPIKSLSILYILIGAIYFIPILFLFRFSINIKTAVLETNHGSMITAFGYLKSLFRFLGIMTIVILSLYLLVFVSALIFGIAASF